MSMPGESVRHPSAKKVDATLESHGLRDRVRELPASTRTAEDAALALGCEVRQIVKSLVFRVDESNTAVLALVAGNHKLDEGWMERRTGHGWSRADPEFVRSAAGFAIGGVPPVGHPSPLVTYVDYDLLEQHEVWAAAGHPHAVFRISSEELLRITQGRPVPVVPLTPDRSLPGPWVSFDCYGTIVDWRKGLFARLDVALGALDKGERDRLFQAFLVEEQRLEAGPYRPYREVLASATRAAVGIAGRSLSGPEAEGLASSIPSWPLFPDSRVALARLHERGFRIAILSNIDRDLLTHTLAEHDLSVDLTVTAEEVRSYKPALAHWIRFLKRTGASPAACLHVAGAYEYDLPPAELLGFRTAFVRRYGATDVGPAAHAAVSDLAELERRLSPDGTIGPRD